MSDALLIIDHGSRRESANLMLDDVVAMVREQAPGLIVEGSHMELAEPDIKQGVASCVKQGATHIIAHPYMLSPGRHAREDIPNMVKEAVASHEGVTCSITDPLGVDVRIGQIILDRAGLG